MTRPDRLRTPRFWETAGQLTSEAAAISPAERSPSQTRRRIWRRRGLAIASIASSRATGLVRVRTCIPGSTYLSYSLIKSFFFFNDRAATQIYTHFLHDAAAGL